MSREPESKSNIVEVAANYALTGQLYEGLKIVYPPSNRKPFATAVYNKCAKLIPQDELFVAQIDSSGAVVMAAPLFKSGESGQMSLEEAETIVKWGKSGVIKGFFEIIGKNGEEKK